VNKRTKLDRSFFSRPTVEVARDLLGRTLVHGDLEDRITEVEAYLPENDPAAHSFRGPTPRTRILYGPPGYAYMYLNYGIHWMLNFAVEPEGVPGCVLIRGTTRFRGPGLLTRGFRLNGEQYGEDLCGVKLYLLATPPAHPREVSVTVRVGITKAMDYPCRFFWRREE
jgi:DNA-3-methyladenine glycosylase